MQDQDERRGKAYHLKLRVKKTDNPVRKLYKSTNPQDQDDDEDEHDEGADVLVEDVDEEGEEEESQEDDDNIEYEAHDVTKQEYETDSDNISRVTDTVEVTLLLSKRPSWPVGNPRRN